MKWLFYVIVLVYMLFRAVYGIRAVENSLSLDPVTEEDSDFIKVGERKTINCKASSRNQKVEWIDPNGDVVKRIPGSRVFSQEHFVQLHKGRAPALVLTISSAKVQDTGVYQCRSGDLVKNASLCVIDPSEFIDTPALVTADLGQSYTLSCQAKGEPEPRLVWIRNGDVITDDDSSTKYREMTKFNHQGFEGLLTITSLVPEDSGVYSCLSIQESTLVENCEHSTIFNITLNVNYAPQFKDGSETDLVYGKNNQEVDITCSAAGFPEVTYRWFNDIGGDVLYEYDKKHIKINEENQAVLTIMANQSTFGQRFKCIASNDLGKAVKYFSLMKMEKPRKPSKIDEYRITGDSIELNVAWVDEIVFPVVAFDIQYIKEQVSKKKIFPPKEVTWRQKGKQAEVTEFNEDSETGGFIVGLSELEDSTPYWIRLRAKNDAGESLWSDAIFITTTTTEEEDPEATTEEPKIEPEPESSEEGGTDATFYGVFFAGGIFVVAVVCMFAMRMVK